MKKFLKFSYFDQTPYINTWFVTNQKGDHLGTIEIYRKKWRFLSPPHTHFEKIWFTSDCLRHLAEKVDSLNSKESGNSRTTRRKPKRKSQAGKRTASVVR